MRQRAGSLLLLVLLVLLLPMSAESRAIHYFTCNDCHRSGASLTTLSNLCLMCHTSAVNNYTTMNNGVPTVPTRRFIEADASNALGSVGVLYNSVTAKEISHIWAANDTNPAAGAAAPSNPVFYGRNNIAKGKVACARCHNSHKTDDVNRLNLKLDNTGDAMCRDCHAQWYVDNTSALLSHPVGPTTTYSDVLAADINGRFNATITNINSGDVRLVQGYVSCTSCHGMHFTDSDSATADSYTLQATMDGDGHQLRSDGPTRANKSALCRACHTYQEHGKMLDGGESVGCLGCHSGHAYNGGVPNYFVLRGTVATSTYGSKSITYTSATQAWNDNTAGTATGYCEVCHGSAETIPKGAGMHTAAEVCRDCHKHKLASGGTYSFQNDANAATCGDCHGFPPYVNARGDRNTGGVNGGYAYQDAAHNYALLADYMDESLTPHNTHAAGGLTQGAATDYNFGSGVEACNPCHNGLSELSSHDTTTDPGSYRDFAWSNLSTAGLLSPAYKQTTPNQWTCSAVYCHSNGGKRNSSGTKVLADYTTLLTPAWLNGKNTLTGNVNECNSCHGNTSSTMTTRNNSTSHGKHLGSGTMLKTYTCNACHSLTATSSTALASGARLVFSGGKHVNGAVDVSFNSSYSLGGATMGSGSYTGGAAGTCTVYCHTNGKGVPASTTPDWDNAASGACGTCHGVTAATLTTGSHAIHIDATKADISCNACHGTGATTGTHTGHVDGLITKLTTTTSCDPCHGIEVGDTSPVWGNNTSIICASCHTGATVTSYTKRAGGTVTAPAKNLAATVGHNRPTASGAYPVTGKPAGNKQCTACHLATVGSGHVDGLGNGDLLVASFSCESCHTDAGSRSAEATVRVKTHSNTEATYTLQKRLDFTKVCLACHDPHGTSNGGMVESAQATQNAKDATGNYGGNVVFSALTGVDSLDEVDTANLDDVCATCHTATTHNNRTASGTHHEGENCATVCHGHNGAKGGFMPSGGNFCNDCHGNPPSATDDRPAGKAGVHAAHVKVASHDASEDKYDCDVCHPGAGSFSLGHADGSVSLAAGITNGTCSAACHYSGNDGVGPLVDDGYWTDTNGMNCDSCHYWSATPTSAGNVASGNREALGASHNKHFDKGKVCVNCHANNGTDTAYPRIHIDDHEAWTLNATNDGTILTDRGNALQDEATVDFALATTKYANWNDTSNSCGVATSNSGLGCHATGAPTWGGSALNCVGCHTDKTTSAVNPTSGLHSVTPLVSGVQHDESFSYNGGLNTGNCETCHTTAPSTGHQDSVMDATRGATGNTKIVFAAAVGYTDAAQPTCAPSLTGCHYEQPTKTVDWLRKWHQGATNATGACAGCHGDWVNGWNANVQHHTNAKAQSTHGTKAGKTYECVDCHALEASTAVYPFTIGSNDWKPTDAAATTLHGNGAINVNSTGTGFLRSGGQSGCPDCHANWATDGKHAYTQTEWTLTTVAGDAPTVTCATCHGGLTVGASAANYWPDKVGNDGSEDNAGRHAIHMTRLAQAKYGETITALLSDNVNGTADVKQKELCSYCHTSPGSDADHGDVAALPAEVNAMFNLWNKGVDDASYVTGNCSNVNCHNGKATSSIADFTWYGAGTGNCALCHNDITVTTAATTGATHDAHVGTPIAAFGKAIACASCHGGSPTWSPYVVPSSGHINGAFSVSGGSVTVSYTGVYTNAATRTVGSCGVNLCHNNGKNAATPAYTWQTAIAGCAACHATSSSLGSSHDPHMNAGFTSTFRSTIAGCAECHDAVTASDMTGRAAHMDGAVTLKAGIAYSGDLAVSGATYGVCSASLCHQNGHGTNVSSPTWNRAPSSADNCTICHASPPATGRHAKHVAETDYVTGCANCHSGATATTIATASHFDGTRNVAGSSSVVYAGTAAGTCTNSCHKVSDGRDWTSGTQPLACTDCHQSGTIAAGKGALPASGLHNMTATGVQKHDATLGTNGCKECHVTPAVTHLDGIFNADSGINTDRFLTRTGMVWTDGAANYGSCFDNGTTGLDYNAGAGCHRDNGVWKRLWSSNANLDSTLNPDPGQLVCDVCHGQYQSLHASSQGWREGSVHYRSGGAANENKGVSHNRTGGTVNACEDCHAYDSSGGANHQNGVLNFSGGNGVPDTYTLTMGTSGWYCATCHNGNSAEVATDTASHTFPDSTAFTSRAYVIGTTQPEGGCTGCHGNNGTGGFWPDGSTAHTANQAGEHPVHALEIAKKLYATATPTVAQQNSTCDYCHPANSHNADTNLPADVSMTDSDNNGSADLYTGTKFKKIIGATADNSGFWRVTPATCSTVACHAGAPYTPHWYADTVAPANVTLTAAAGPVPRSIKLSWTAVGDDGTLDGTAYKYDIRMGTSSATAIDFASTSNYVQGVPTVKRSGSAQEAIIHNVNPSTAYYFALRTYDRDGNYGSTANAGGYVSYAVSATPDTTPPVLTGSPTWYGLDSAKALDTSGTIKLSWTRAEDHSMPITYDIWWSEGSITYGTPQASTKDTSYRAIGLTDGNTYNFAVRAKDAYGNTDTNSIVMQVIPQGLAAVPKTNTTYYAQGAASSGNVTMQTAVHTTDGTNAGTTTFIGPTAFTSDTTIYANSFSVNIDNGATAAVTMQAELGYITGTTTWNSFSTPLMATDLSVAKKAVRVITFKFNGAQRTMLGSWNGGAGAKLGVKVSVKSGGPIDSIGWGPTSKGGILAFASQPINISPTTPTVSTSVSGANVGIWWAASTDSADGVADTVHYDVYGSANGGLDGFPHVIATGLTTNATSGAPLVWDTQAAGIALSVAVSNVQVRVEAGDVINGKTLSHTPSTSGNLAIDNSGDSVAPGTIGNFKAETRPKQGSVYLSWTAPGDDGANNGRASYYDIRYATAVINDETKFSVATPLVSEPYPDFGGNGQGYEVLDLASGNYYFAIKAVDDGGKLSSLAYTASTTAAGPKCGICHSTPPDEAATKGNHATHGYTINDCADCHGNDPSTGAQTFTTAHQDGVIKLGWKTATPQAGTFTGNQINYTQSGLTIYSDASGGGFNVVSGDTGDKADNGSCFNWSSLNVSGCHGPATSASWDAAATLVCSACHGDNARTVDNYSHSFDDASEDVKAAPPIDNHGYDGTGATEAERKYVGAHIAHLNYSFRLSKGDSCRLCHGSSRPGSSLHADGIIDVNLDLAAAGSSATWAPGTLTTAGTCASMSPDSCHPSTATPKWDSAQTFACTNCHGMGGTTPSHVTDPNKLINLADNDADSGDPMPGNCTWCHIGGHPKEKKITSITKASPAVVTTENAHNLTTNDKVTIHTSTGMTEINNKTYLVTVINATQFSLQLCDSTSWGTFDYGTWIEGNGTGIILVPNDSRVGIAYQSGGIHLKANIGARGEVGSEAELCWSCHGPNSISEWGGDSGPTNTVTAPGNGNVYNFGTLNQANWVGATWTSGVTGTYGFGYKTGTIRSTHSTDPTGTSALTGTDYAYTNGGVDPVNKIRCSNCHDVHNSNKSKLAADGLDPTGPPYLRGTWKSNPYKEDGAPQAGQTYLVQGTAALPGYGYGQVPRANPSTTNAMGGYWIDQNSGSPTSGWTYESSASLCQLCHSATVDELDQKASENLWLSATNGHANSALGGSGSGAANIFLQGAVGEGRNGADGATGGSGTKPNVNAWMAFENTVHSGTTDYGYGPRSGDGAYLTPFQSPSKVKMSVLVFAWGNTVDASTVEVGYHQFSCSKCHNPHASRLPKLMITNCLDVTHNTWDLNYDDDSGTGTVTTTNANTTGKWLTFGTATSSWSTKRLSHLSTAQNCHRYVDVNGDNVPDEKGWNKVTPW